MPSHRRVLVGLLHSLPFPPTPRSMVRRCAIGESALIRRRYAVSPTWRALSTCARVTVVCDVKNRCQCAVAQGLGEAAFLLSVQTVVCDFIVVETVFDTRRSASWVAFASPRLSVTGATKASNSRCFVPARLGAVETGYTVASLSALHGPESCRVGREGACRVLGG